MDFRETDEQHMLREAVGAIAAKYGHDYYVRCARSGVKADELWAELGSHGFLGVNVPESFGGGGMGISELAIVLEELATHGCPLLLMVVSPAICATIVERFGSDAQKERWLGRFATGELKMAFGITEPDAGSNSHNISTTATRDGDVYRLSGTKYYISGADESEAVLVVTRTGTDEHSGRGRLSLFVVDLDSVGLEKTVIPVEIVAPEKQFTLFFDNVVVPADRLLGAEGEGLRQVFMGLNPERIMSAALANGIGRYALDKAAAYAPRPQRLGYPHRPPPGPGSSAGQGEDRGRAGPAHDAEGGLGLRPRRGRRGAGQHGQVLGSRGGHRRARPGHPDARRQRHGLRVRPGRPVGRGAPDPHGAGQP